MPKDLLKPQSAVICSLLAAALGWFFLIIVSNFPRVSAEQQGRGTSQSAQPADLDKKFDRLMAKVKQKGSVRVIVQVAAIPEASQPLISTERRLAREQVTSHAQADVLNKIGKSNQDRKVKKFSTIPFIALEADQSTLDQLKQLPEVISIEEDIPVPPLLAESIPLINAEDAWSKGFTGTGQAVAILDTGVDYTHPFLTGKMSAEGCYSDSWDDGTSLCPNGLSEDIGAGSGLDCESTADGCDHGTHVAGIAVGKGGSFSGVAKEGDLISIQVFTEFVGDDFCGEGYPSPCLLSNPTDMILGLERVLELHNSGETIAAVNMSLGGDSYSADCDGDYPALTAAINNLRAVGIATVIASGNNSYWGTISAPACISSAISVGASTDGDDFASFSNIASILDVVAPGFEITSSVPGGTYQTWSGTSMASPMVAGAVAVIRSKDTSATVDVIESVMKSSGVSVSESWSELSGISPNLDTRVAGSTLISKPRIDVGEALSLTAKRVVIQDSTGSNVATLDDDGEVVLAGTCAVSAECVAPAESLIIQNSVGETVSYIDSAGNLCIESGDCSDQSVNCDSPSGDAFLITDDSGATKSYIDETGDFCAVGMLIESGSP